MTSKRNSSSSNGSGVAAPPSSHFNDQGVRERWSVLVYRLQSHRGWEVYSDPDNEVATTSATNSASGVSGKKNNAAAGNKSIKIGSNASNGSSGGVNDASSTKAPRVVEELTAAPRLGCIEVRKMRLRIQLFQQHTPWNPSHPPPPSRRGKENQRINTADKGDDKSSSDKVSGNVGNDDGGYDSDTPGEDGWNNNSLLVRRHNTLMVTTRRGMGAVVFRFKSSRDCIEFCDRLVYLNREYLTPSRSLHDEDDAEDTIVKKRAADDQNSDIYVNGMDRREQHIDELNGLKRRKCSDQGILATKLEPRPQSEVMNEEAPPTSEEMKQCQRQEQMMSYIVQLAHSEEFRGFVDELERGLELGEDTAAIHAALGL